jgi:hypothetical protein
MDKATHTVTTSALHIVYEQTGPDSGEPIFFMDSPTMFAHTIAFSAFSERRTTG